ncbi:hypothetical protein D3C86_2189850 [compost metagenome]
MGFDIIHGLRQLGAVPLLDLLGGQLNIHQCDGMDLNAEPFQQLPFIADHGPEGGRPWPDLQNPQIAELADHIGG